MTRLCRIPPLRRGFTLIELLVVMAILGVLVALLLPAIQKVRESANRTRCVNNVKQLALACQHYNTTHGYFPPGCVPSPAKFNANDYNYGHSWLLLTLPYLDQQPIFDKLDLKGATNTATGLVYPNSYLNNGANGFNGNLLRGMHFGVMYCPSSSLPKWGLTGLTPPGPEGVFRPTYTGVGGAIDHASTVNRDATTGTPHDAVGRVSFGGVLILRRTPGPGIRVSQISDGTSNTLLIGEQSGYCFDSTGARKDCRSDYNHGFCMGPRSTEYRNWNTTSVRYKINVKNWNLTGVGNDFYAPNRPIQSVHPGGAVVGFGDGSARFVDEALDLQMLFNLSNRDDGKTVSY